MTKQIDILELFSGIGGFSKGFQDAGFTFKNHYYSEVDKHAISNYKYNFTNAEYIGSVTDVRGNGIEHPDIITFGSPCQDFSLAGKRSGLEGQRSVLILEAIRIIRECRPSVFIWENVKGAFSSNAGADFWAIIAAVANIGGYRLEWQLLNTAWFLPQNRERIYLVGHLDGFSECGIFPIGEGDERNYKTRGKGKFRDNYSQIAATLKQRDWKGGTNFIQYGKGYNSQQDRAFYEEGNMGCIPSTRTENKINVLTNSNIRRLTEIECERLQGFPDNWTEFGNYDGKIKSIPKTQRYKMCGNAVTTNVVKAIAERIKLL